MTGSNIAPAPLVYNGQIIHDHGDMLCLTDMWKAQGSPSGRGPSDWLALLSSKEFVLCVEASLNAGGAGIRRKKGRNGNTFAHWQIGLAYAKYLSPEFHMACNAIVRERMERRIQHTALPEELAEYIRRTDGISRMLAHKVTGIEQAMERLAGTVVAPTFDYAGTITSIQIIDLAGIAKADRVRGTSNMVTHAMLDFCDGCGCSRTAADLNAARPWRFPADKAREWLFGSKAGVQQIRNQIARRKRASNRPGQTSLQLVQPSNSLEGLS